MKRLPFVFVFMLMALFNYAQNKYLNTKTPYHSQQLLHTLPPKGYGPVFINYVGRHGARFLTSACEDVYIAEVLQQAKQHQGLTNLGLFVLEQLQRFDSVEKSNYGNITLLGASEQHDISERLQKAYRPVFSNARLLVETTDKVRTQQSAKAFLSGLKGYDSNVTQFLVFPHESDSLLQFYDLSKEYGAYASGAIVNGHIDSLKNNTRTNQLADEVGKKMFTNAFVKQIMAGDIRAKQKGKEEVVSKVDFTSQLYNLYCILFSFQKEMQLGHKQFENPLRKAFSNDHLSWLERIISAADFYKKGPGEDNLGIPVTIAAPLLRDIITTTDSMIAHKKFNVILRFTHAEAISPLATLMGISAATKESLSVFSFSTNWKA
ncbi:MAG: histidine-type phosphatase [Bacteroidota bacterium]|nr:histidine-type phosphatase [Bacteroidota bacterium]